MTKKLGVRSDFIEELSNKIGIPDTTIRWSLNVDYQSGSVQVKIVSFISVDQTNDKFLNMNVEEYELVKIE